MTRIVVLDDHALFRVGLIAILSKDPEMNVVGEYNTFAQFKSLIPTLQADVVLLDISLNDENGLDIAKYIKHANPSLKVIVLSSHKEEFYIISALEAEVDGYIHKDVDPEELIRGLKRVIMGNSFFSSEISNLLINNIYTRPKGGIPFLTNKEKEVISYLVDGFSSKEIADKLDVSPRTIETHRANVLNKFNLKNTTELIKKIIERKIQF